jgi:hypothetical protein
MPLAPGGRTAEHIGVQIVGDGSADNPVRLICFRDEVVDDPHKKPWMYPTEGVCYIINFYLVDAERGLYSTSKPKES